MLIALFYGALHWIPKPGPTSSHGGPGPQDISVYDEGGSEKEKLFVFHASKFLL
jgi:hypothetical protein